MEALRKIQVELKAPKNKKNTFGNYNYRSAEDILEAVKPLLDKYGATMTISDSIQLIGERYYVTAKVTVTDGKTTVTTEALAREEESKKGMDGSQITGTASSYARKYALNGMFLIDDTKDADTDEFKTVQQAAIEREGGDEPLSKSQLKAIRDRIAKGGFNEDKVAAHFLAKSLDELTKSQFYDVNEYLNKWEKKLNEK